MSYKVQKKQFRDCQINKPIHSEQQMVLSKRLLDIGNTSSIQLKRRVQDKQQNTASVRFSQKYLQNLCTYLRKDKKDIQNEEILKHVNSGYQSPRLSYYGDRQRAIKENNDINDSNRGNLSSYLEKSFIFEGEQKKQQPVCPDESEKTKQWSVLRNKANSRSKTPTKSILLINQKQNSQNQNLSKRNISPITLNKVNSKVKQQKEQEAEYQLVPDEDFMIHKIERGKIIKNLDSKSQRLETNTKFNSLLRVI